MHATDSFRCICTSNSEVLTCRKNTGIAQNLYDGMLIVERVGGEGVRIILFFPRGWPIPTISYESNAFPQTHPNRLATLGILFGMRPAVVARCRVLGLGCASGGNLFPMAVDYPDSHFVGDDLSGKQAAEGQQNCDFPSTPRIRLPRDILVDLIATYISVSQIQYGSIMNRRTASGLQFWTLIVSLLLLSHAWAQDKPKVEQRPDLVLKLSDKVELVCKWIPPGKFTMGHPKSEPNQDSRFPDSHLQHEVEITRPRT